MQVAPKKFQRQQILAIQFQVHLYMNGNRRIEMNAFMHHANTNTHMNSDVAADLGF